MREWQKYREALQLKKVNNALDLGDKIEKKLFY